MFEGAIQSFFFERELICYIMTEIAIRFPAMGDWGGIEDLNQYSPTMEWNAQLMDDLCANNA